MHHSEFQRQHSQPRMPRRRFVQAAAAMSAAGASLEFLRTVAEAAAEPPVLPAFEIAGQETDSEFRLRYMLASSLYGYLYLGEILPEVRQTGALAIDLWPKVHGNQREQVDDFGQELFQRMLDEHGIRLGCITQYKLGPFGLQDEMLFAKQFGCPTIVTGGHGQVGLSGDALKGAVAAFVEQMKPHLAVAEELGVVIAIENHANNLIESPDSLRWLAELAADLPLGIALAPYHLPQEPSLLAQLIRDLGSKINVFYAWQHGQGSMQRQAKERELEQLPGRGQLDFGPLVQALVDIDYSGWTEIFMHPFPRGIPMMETVPQIRDELNASRTYLDGLIA